MSTAEVDIAIDLLCEEIDKVACDTHWTHAESVEIFGVLAAHCSGWAAVIKKEMEEGIK